jgi:hypothetical protein
MGGSFSVATAEHSLSQRVALVRPAVRLGQAELPRPTRNSTISRQAGELSTFHFPLSTFHFPLSTSIQPSPQSSPPTLTTPPPTLTTSLDAMGLTRPTLPSPILTIFPRLRSATPHPCSPSPNPEIIPAPTIPPIDFNIPLPLPLSAQGRSFSGQPRVPRYTCPAARPTRPRLQGGLWLWRQLLQSPKEPVITAGLHPTKDITLMPRHLQAPIPPPPLPSLDVHLHCLSRTGPPSAPTALTFP